MLECFHFSPAADSLYDRVAIRQVFPGHVRDFSGKICVREKC